MVSKPVFSYISSTTFKQNTRFLKKHSHKNTTSFLHNTYKIKTTQFFRLLTYLLSFFHSTTKASTEEAIWRGERCTTSTDSRTPTSPRCITRPPRRPRMHSPGSRSSISETRTQYTGESGGNVCFYYLQMFLQVFNMWGSKQIVGSVKNLCNFQVVVTWVLQIVGCYLVIVGGTIVSNCGQKIKKLSCCK